MTVASKPDRIDYVDAVRVILILLVVAHHSVESYVTAHPPEVPLPDPPLARGGIFLWVNAAFFMGLFFFSAATSLRGRSIARAQVPSFRPHAALGCTACAGDDPDRSACGLVPYCA